MKFLLESRQHNISRTRAQACDSDILLLWDIFGLGKYADCSTGTARWGLPTVVLNDETRIGICEQMAAVLRPKRHTRGAWESCVEAARLLVTCPKPGHRPTVVRWGIRLRE